MTPADPPGSVNRFAQLLDRLAFEHGRNAKLRLMTEYFRANPDPERGFSLAALTGALSFRHAKPGMIRALIAERSDPVLFGLSYDYVGDLSVRLALYRRLAEIEDEREIDAFGAELIDRFGPLPPEVDHLLKIVAIKGLCRRANVEKIEAGPKGAVITLRDNTFARPEALVAFIRDQGPSARVRPDMKVVFFADWERPTDRLKGAARILSGLVGIAEPAKAA